MHFSDIFFMLWKRNMTNLAFKITDKNGGSEITPSFNFDLKGKNYPLLPFYNLNSVEYLQSLYYKFY